VVSGLRILHVNGNAHLAGGTETYLARLLSAQVEDGHDVAFLHQHPRADFPEGVTYAPIESEESTRKRIETFRPDVLHLHDWSLPADAEDALVQTFPSVRTFHTFSFGCCSGERYFRDGRVCTRAHGPGCIANLVLRGCAHRVDLRSPLAQYGKINRRLKPISQSKTPLVFASEFVRSVGVLNGLSPERCHVVPYFVARAEEPPHANGSRAVAFVGRVSRSKGVDVLLEALASIRGSWSRLLVVGDGWDRRRCAEIARRLGIGGNVDFLGWLPPAGVADALRRARVLALPSRWPEPFGIAGIEAMAQARPVVASRIGGIPEWLEDGETGVLVEPGDPTALATGLASLLDDDARAERAGLEGWRKAARFSVERHLDLLAGVYRQAAAP
jgi:glycosyltransferase involved in cell wall biosynthesis